MCAVPFGALFQAIFFFMTNSIPPGVVASLTCPTVLFAGYTIMGKTSFIFYT